MPSSALRRAAPRTLRPFVPRFQFTGDVNKDAFLFLMIAPTQLSRLSRDSAGSYAFTTFFAKTVPLFLRLCLDHFKTLLSSYASPGAACPVLLGV